MCRNIRPLNNFEPPATRDEVTAAALQYVRKVTGTTKPSQANQAAFDAAVRRSRTSPAPPRRPRDHGAAEGPRRRGGQGRARAQPRYGSDTATVTAPRPRPPRRARRSSCSPAPGSRPTRASPTTAGRALRCAMPMTYQEFVSGPGAQQRYWARATSAGPGCAAVPNAGHRALAALDPSLARSPRTWTACTSAPGHAASSRCTAGSPTSSASTAAVRRRGRRCRPRLDELNPDWMARHGRRCDAARR